MEDEPLSTVPPAVGEIAAATQAAEFSMASDSRTGALLRALAASKPAGTLLELGTGTGIGTAWLLDGMDAAARLVSIDLNRELSAIAGRFLGTDPRLTLVVADAERWLDETQEGPFDLIFADAMPGKYPSFQRAWKLLRRGGFYVIDDMLPLPSWPSDHAERVDELLVHLDERPDCKVARMAWSSGLVVAVRT